LQLQNRFIRENKELFLKSSLFYILKAVAQGVVPSIEACQKSTGLFLEKCPEIAYNCDQVTKEIGDIRCSNLALEIFYSS